MRAGLTPFTKLQGVGPDRVDEAITAFTDEDWERLETGYLDLIALDVTEHLDPLGLAEDADRMVLLCHLYAALLARHPYPEV